MRFSVKSNIDEAIDISVRFTRAKRDLDMSIADIVEDVHGVVSGLVIDAIRDQMPNVGIGDFMANRTVLIPIVSGNTLTITVTGLPEGEVANRERSDGTAPKVSSGAVNLWMVHEHGGGRWTDESRGETTTYVKDIGGVSATRQSRAAGAPSPYVGMVGKIVQGLTPQIRLALRVLGGMTAGVASAVMVEKATRGRVRVDKSAQAALKRAGLSKTDLAMVKVTRVETTSRGQINYRGSAGRFVSVGGAPTTVRTR